MNASTMHPSLALYASLLATISQADALPIDEPAPQSLSTTLTTNLEKRDWF
jgi:hypothetical protein